MQDIYCQKANMRGSIIKIHVHYYQSREEVRNNSTRSVLSNISIIAELKSCAGRNRVQNEAVSISIWCGVKHEPPRTRLHVYLVMHMCYIYMQISYQWYIYMTQCFRTNASNGLCGRSNRAGKAPLLCKKHLGGRTSVRDSCAPAHQRLLRKHCIIYIHTYSSKHIYIYVHIHTYTYTYT